VIQSILRNERIRLPYDLFYSWAGKATPPRLTACINQPTKEKILHDIQLLKEVIIENRNMNTKLNMTLMEG
jgi:hypothetical protein